MSRIGILFKRYFPIFLAVLFLLGQPAGALAEEQYASDNSLRADPLQRSKQKGQIQVGEFTGAAIYEYPIKLPQGRNGLTPSVTVIHNSQDESLDYQVGYHWSLNMYSIERLNKRGVENIYSRNDYVATTPFSSGELVNISGNLFQEKYEGSFAKYEKEGDGWKVTDKSGTQYFFGISEETRQFDPSNTSHTYKWMLEEIRDPNDNFIRYEYEKVNNQMYPKSIIYTGHGQEDGIFEVRYIRSNDLNLDFHYSYASGFLIETKYLIDAIEIYVNSELQGKYEFGYSTIDPMLRKILKSITETVYDEDRQAKTLPATTFDYTPSTISWQKSDLYQPPVDFVTAYSDSAAITGTHPKAFFWDLNGDGLMDVPTASRYGDARFHIHYLNDGKGGWIPITNQELYVYSGEVPNRTLKPTDFNGDIRMDYISSYINTYVDPARTESRITYSNGTGAGENPIPVAMGMSQFDLGASVADLNGDGLPDIIQKRLNINNDGEQFYSKGTCLNKDGSVCISTNLWEAPAHIIYVDNIGYQYPRNAYVEDCNSDGLADFINPQGTGGFYINDGKGGWVAPQGAQVCTYTPLDGTFYRSIDLNGDGLMDRVHAYYEVLPYGSYDPPQNFLYLNIGRGLSGDIGDFPILLGHGNGTGQNQADYSGIRFMDLNGDLLTDIVESRRFIEDHGNVHEETVTRNVWLHTGSRPYYLKTVHTSEGGEINLEYKTSAQYLKEDGTLANPKLPIIITTVSKMTTKDGMGNTNTINYFYEDGHYYFASSYDRSFAGFRVVTKTDNLGYKTKNYYHQSQQSVNDSAGGEYSDHIAKKGHVYRSEVYDNSGNVIAININKYDNKLVGSDRYYPYLANTLNQVINGGVTKSTAKSFIYDQYGNQTEIIDYGEVTAGAGGSFTDIGDDLIKTVTTYVPNNGQYMVAYPSEVKIYNIGDELLSQSHSYYDGQDLGQVVKGNLTAQESWLDTNDSWLKTETEYDDYGMPTLTRNARGFETVMQYDANHLYPASVTNAKGQQTSFEYNLISRKPSQVTDPNGSVMMTEYDGLGRPTRVERDGVLLNTTAYQDSSRPRWIAVETYLDDGQSVSQNTFLDAFDRKIEVKKEVSGGKWVVTQTIYDTRGNIKKQVQPYFSSSGTFEALNISKIGNYFNYDALNRITSINNPLGTTTNTYTGWEIKTVDPEGHEKTVGKDARGNLIRVQEKNGGETYITNYSYDALGQLMSTQDAQGNIRSYDYDSLGRRKFQTQLATDDKWRYQYDANGNLTQKTDPKNQITVYSYDEMDRILTEDFQGESGTEYTYQYDTGANAIGRLNKVYSPGYEHNLTYDLWGRVAQDSKNISGETFDFAYIYDRMGGVTSMTYPDGTVVGYDYDSAHQLRSVKVGLNFFADNFQYAPTGQLTEMTLGNGVVVSSTYDPDQMYRMTAKTATNDLQNYNYTYDALGNLTRLVDMNTGATAKTVDYSYDDLSRLLSAAYTGLPEGDDFTQSYQYDPIGNMTYKSDVGDMAYGASHPHAVDTAGDHTYSYDDNGNMTAKDDTAMTYDYRDRLVESAGEASFTYGEATDRMTKTDLTTGETTYYPEKYFESSASEEVRYIYAGDTMLGKFVKTIQQVIPPEDLEPEPDDPTPDPDDPNPTPEPGNPNPTPIPDNPSPAPASVPAVSSVTTSSSGSSSAGRGGYGSQERLQLMRLIGEGHMQQAKELAQQLAHYQLKAIAQEADNVPREGSLPEHSFDNLKIQYNLNSAVITWDAMPDKIAYFKVYRSKGSHAGPDEDPQVFLKNVPAGRFNNHFVDNHKEGYAKYSYKIEAVSKHGSVLLTSINLHSKQIFIYENQTKIVDFRNFSDKDFSKVKIYSNEFVDGRETSIPQRLFIEPDEGLESGARIKVRFLDCYKKRDGSDYCKNMEEQYVEVYLLARSKPLQKTVAFMGDQVKRLAGAFVPKAYAEEDEKTYYFLTDHLGSVDVVLDENGEVVERRDFLPYGAERMMEGADSGTDRGFTGKELDEETGLNYYGARYYDSSAGRFISLDPWEGDLSDPQSLNKYAYVRNNPILLVDPTGEVYHIAAGFLAGAFLGAGMQAFNDIMTGTPSSIHTYAASIAGGAIQGMMVAAVPTAAVGVIAGMTGAATTNALDQYGSTGSVEGGEVFESAFVGGVTSFVPGPKAVRGSAAAITKQMNTKFANGMIDSVTAKTGANMFIGNVVEALPGAVMEESAQIGSVYLNSATPSVSIAGQTLSYTVQAGDTLSGLFGGDWKSVASYNQLSNPNQISIGQKLYLPKKKDKEKD